MKNVIYTFTIAVTLMAGSLFYSCQASSVTPEEEAAQAKVDSAKLELKDAQKAATAEEWEAFKVESAEKIRINELTIADYKDRRSTSEAKFDPLYAEKIDKLEKQNKALKNRVDNYEKRQKNWASFKREFNHDVDELANAINDLTVDNKK
jgi:hypothetical protein